MRAEIANAILPDFFSMNREAVKLAKKAFKIFAFLACLAVRKKTSSSPAPFRIPPKSRRRTALHDRDRRALGDSRLKGEEPDGGDDRQQDQPRNDT